jgi:hypothetical protein
MRWRTTQHHAYAEYQTLVRVVFDSEFLGQACAPLP